MTAFEWLTVVYFAGLGLSRAHRSRARGLLYAAGALLLVIVARFTASWNVRVWLPHAYLMLGYWIPAALTDGINERFERWLAAGWMPAARCGPLLHLLEVAYLLCYPLVPAAFAAVFLLGSDVDVARFWVAVLLAGYACYGSLPWTAARPPRLLGRAGRSDAEAPALIAAANVYVLGRVSHNLNTFPSGHVAVSVAAALALWPLSSVLSAALLIVAAMIAAAAVAGRYHFAIDVALGMAVGAAAAAVALVVGRGAAA